jgi:hypothetical protein
VLHSLLVPTNRRRHAITETPPVEAALNELRQALGTDRVDLSELVILGAREKLERLRVEDKRNRMLRKQFADRIRRGEPPLDVDLEALEEVRRAGRARLRHLS